MEQTKRKTKTLVGAFEWNVLNEIEKYNELWADQMPQFNGLSFRIQMVNDKYRTVVLGHKSKSDIVCTNVRDVIDFSELKATPNEAWDAALLDKYAFMLRNELTFTSDASVFQQINKLIESAVSFKDVDAKELFSLIKKGKFSLNESAKMNQHPKLIFDAIKSNNRVTIVTGGKLKLFIKFRVTDEDNDNE